MKSNKSLFALIVVAALFSLFCGLETAAQKSVKPDTPSKSNSESVGAPGCSLVPPFYTVDSIDELYSTVNLPGYQAEPWPIFIFPGNYLLSVNDTVGNPRPNGGRLEFQPNMALCGTTGNRAAVVIDAANLPATSYSGELPNSGIIRLGNGDNTIEWLTVKNAVAGVGIIVHRSSPGTSRIRIAHVASTGSNRGADIRNAAGFQPGFHIEADVVDSDFHNNRTATAQGMRIINTNGVGGNSITVDLSGNRFFDNQQGLIVENIGSTTNGVVTVTSNGDRFYNNGGGAFIGGALGPTNNSTSNFTAIGSVFENNNGVTDFFRGGLNVAGGATFQTPNGGSNNFANVLLRNCVFSNNQVADLAAYGAASLPTTIGISGTNNRAFVRLFNTPVPNLVSANTSPVLTQVNNSVGILRSAPFDFDWDGKADLSIYRFDWPTYQWWILNSRSSSVTFNQLGEEDNPPVPADYDGDGQTDTAVVDIWGSFPAARWWIRNSSTSTYTFPLWGGIPDHFVPADYDGDGKADLAIWRPSNGTWWIKQSSNGVERVQAWGTNGDRPVPADFDGDGKADLTVFRPSNGTWWTINSLSGTVSINQFGVATDKLIPADYTGDGRADIAVWRPSDGGWWVLDSTTGAASVQQWGIATDIPAPADYDGDGKTDFGIFRPSGGDWWILNASGSYSVTHWGTNGDIPTPSAFVR